MTTLSKRKLSVYLAALFLAGAGSGALVAWQIARRTPMAPLPTAEIGAHIREHLKSRLSLSPEQVQKIDPFIDQGMARIEVIRRDTAGAIFANVSNFDQQVMQVLSPEQKARFEEYERERRAYLRQKFGPATNVP
ncbi:MAG TPA: hypothetical protein VMU04_02210 [Candidatus Acidoferrum sp.]|nr:hypothetical protein [Candidatus Acidoferrum sp.]